MPKITFSLSLFLYLLFFSSFAQNAPSILIQNVNIFNGKTNKIFSNQNVVITENKIAQISALPISQEGIKLIIDGTGKTLMPGLIDNHVHLTFGALSQAEMLNPNLTPEFILEKTSIGAEKMLLRGFTAVRDVGGPIFELKALIDKGLVKGPRVWPAGRVISQTSGHGDFRMPHEHSRRFHGEISLGEKFGATFIADGRDEVLTAVRENLRFGASQIKLMAGGGTSSAYDPVEVTQYTFDEMKAAVEAAEDWGTYVTVHAYTTRAVRRAVDAGVKCVEHGQLLDLKTLKLMKKKRVWLSCQYLIESTEAMDELRKEKRKPVIEGQEKVWPMAKKLKMKIAWGTDFLFEPELNELQNEYITKLSKWFSNYEILKLVTHDNAQLLALSGLRSPYQGKLGVVEEGALADLILVDGNPLQDINLLNQYDEKFVLILKNGEIFKNTISK